MNHPITCLIVDDEPLAQEVIQNYIGQMPGLELVASCNNALEAMKQLQQRPIDLMFLDIQMPVLTGMEFVRSLQHPPAIIFTTAYRDYAVESYELNVIDYLLKPISFTRFFQAVNKYLHTISSPTTTPPATATAATTPTPTYLFVNANKKHIKISFSDILYVESLKDYIRIHTESARIMTKEKISTFETKLPGHFLRIHRSFIVNVEKITAFTAHDVELGETEIPIGGSYKQQVMEVLKEKNGA